MTFHPHEFLHRTGISEALRSLPVIGGIVLLFVGGMIFAIGVATRDAGSALSWAGMAIALVTSAGLMAGGIALLWRGIGDIRARRALARTGTPTTGRVVRVEASALTINDVTQLAVRFRYRDGEGREHEGVTPSMAPEDANLWREGGEGHVRYDPVRPSRAVWMGRSSLDLPPAKRARRGR